MMNDFSLLQKLLNPDVLVNFELEHKKVKLFEKQKNYGIDVKNLPNSTLVIKADSFLPDKIIDCSNNKGFCKRADYIIVNEYETIFVELKRRNTKGKKHVMQQLMGAQCLMDYVISIGRRFF